VLASLAALALAASPFADVETGVAFSGYNDVQVPNAGDAGDGTRFSLHDLGIAPAPYFRASVGVRFGRNEVFATAAPLRLQAKATLPQTIRFAGGTYDAGTTARALYRFDSYRLTWRYAVVRDARWDVRLGATAFLRDAAISLDGLPGGVRDSSNVGFVPLVSFRVAWWPWERFGFLLDGDAIAGLGPGRAEDVLVAFQARLREGVVARIGWRIVEGGADVDQVYNFALVNLVGVGLAVEL
jgi:hypothetical protein